MIKPCVPGVRPTTNSGAQRDMTLSFIVNHRIGRIFSKVNRDLFSVVILMLIASAALCYGIIQFYGAEREKVITALGGGRSEEHTSELQSLMRISYAVFCLKKKQQITNRHIQSANRQ